MDHPFIATGIGTLPHPDAEPAVDAVLSRLPQMPYWPQLPARSPGEDMNLQYAAALTPLLSRDMETRACFVNRDISREEALAGFYERALAEDLAGFVPRPEDAAGFYLFLERIRALPQGDPPWIKGHVTGPLTLAAGVAGVDGKAALFDDEVAEAVAMGLGLAAAAQAGLLAETGRRVMMFVDEPYLSGFGSAFTPVSRERVVELLALTIGKAREHCDALFGVHCCGNTDWSMIVDCGADVLNLDSFGYGGHLLLYPESVAELLGRGGAVAWGAVPTLDFTGQETGEELTERLLALLAGLEKTGISREALAKGALVTPACGMGTLDLDKSLAILDLTARVSALARERYAV